MRVFSIARPVTDTSDGQAPIDAPPAETARRLRPSCGALFPAAAILLAILFGFFGGYLDLLVIVCKKYWWNPEGYFRNAIDFPWTVPLGHVVLLFIPGMAVAATNWLRPGTVTLRAATWLFATLAIWAALLRMPLYAACSLLLAAGSGKIISGGIAARGLNPRLMRATLAASLVLLSVLTALSSGRQAAGEYRTLARLPPAPPAARNVVLIVWDTVRAYNLSIHRYPRLTTPNLARWARKGVVYNSALAPAPWTYPSHTSFFTGQWPLKLNSQWKFTLDTPDPTLAEYLGSLGYQTAGFVANTNCCNYETGLARGFAHFEDYVLSPASLLSRTVAGKLILKELVGRGNAYAQKWIELESRDAAKINDAFLNWLNRRRPDRPFFAFLNCFDAHEPFIPRPGFEGRFGTRPTTARDFQLLLDFVGIPKDRLKVADILMARDCYDDCIAYLDEQLGRLLDELQRRGLLENTDVFITSDHGEAFGDHGICGHSYTVNLDEIGVPLVILSPRAPAGRLVDSPVSLRDLPATVVDLLDLPAVSPFPGGSIAVHWGLAPGRLPPSATSPAFSEQAGQTAFQPQPSRRLTGFQLSIVALGRHYIREASGVERLYDLTKDPFERINLIDPGETSEAAAVLRRMLLELLCDNPGSPEVEGAYLKRFRNRLQADVQDATLHEFPVGLDGRTPLDD